MALGLELIFLSSVTSSCIGIVPVAAAKCPPAEPPLDTILSGITPKASAFFLTHLMADFASFTA